MFQMFQLNNPSPAILSVVVPSEIKCDKSMSQPARDAGGCGWGAHRASIDSEGAAVDVAGLRALRVHQECCSSKVANQHAFPRCQQGAQVHTHPAAICWLLKQTHELCCCLLTLDALVLTTKVGLHGSKGDKPRCAG